MQRLAAPFAAALAGLGAVLLLTGCAGEGKAVQLERRAAPQEAALDWIEPFPATGPALVFEVERFAVTKTGWEAEVAVRNGTKTPFLIPEDSARRLFGVMLFTDGTLADLQRRSESGDVPAPRRAREYDPELPSLLRANQTWRGTISAPGSLPAGRWVRLVFGPFRAAGDPPEGIPRDVVWITDHAYRLRPTAS